MMTVNRDEMPQSFPTHAHSPQFWEALGRAVATYGFLEEVLGKAIFAFTATRQYPDDEIEDAFRGWLPKLEAALTDNLLPLIAKYADAVRQHQADPITDFDQMIAQLKQAAQIRNVLCHGSWPPPREDGTSIPLFVTKRLQVFDTPIDIAFLEETQRAVVGLSLAVMETVTSLGWRFPGSTGPGKRIW
jgi:hypothetical protein